MANRLVMLLVSLLSYLLFDGSAAVTFSSKLIHRFSDEAKERWISRGGNASVAGMWPKKESVEFMDLLLLNDLKRQKMRVDLQSSNKSQYQLLFPSQGSHTLYFGNQFYWLHYTWIDIGTPNVSFLVALDAGSNILWVPCQCIECAPLSASNYTSLERDLSEFDPTISSSSKNLSCGDQLCKPHSNCKSLKDPCPYIAQYASQDTTSSGYLVEDVLHLASVSNYASKSSVQASVIIGCGRKQTGSYLDGAAPDGLMGLGLGDISVPTLLAKAGFIPNSFSICFDENDSGRIFFGDQGPASQQSTPFLPIGEKYDTYFVEVESYCVGSSCLQQSGFKALVDSGSSFTFLPTNVYDNVISKGFTVFCLTVMPADGDFGIIGQNFMMGHRMVFDRENFKLGWSLSNCEDVSDRTHVHLVPPPDGGSPTPLPTNEQQSTSNASTVSPATGKRGSSKSSALSILQLHSLFLQMSLLILLICLFQPSD
ncbi:aspartic proteinase-like protein 1 isoform X2 [Mangifera indica]|uniref:aspartic proteinase-like protein 1 isoform X2 n=1 Tax=Mangifera indica TaxID=29780 RepID=UPI001CFC16FE|nr:aspartic proteinase-like protein 1 isoform X2 [Mangifera indica]